jgi:hypothetical protein
MGQKKALPAAEQLRNLGLFMVNQPLSDGVSRETPAFDPHTSLA